MIFQFSAPGETLELRKDSVHSHFILNPQSFDWQLSDCY